jgi:hypothetical protein
MQKIDCSLKCRMTSAIKSSKFCTKSATITEDGIRYDCAKEMSSLSKEEIQFFTCELWDLGLKDSCNTCNLKCVNNKNPEFQKTLNERKKLEGLIETLKPNMFLYGVSADQVEKISNTYTKNGGSNLGNEAIKIAKFANQALESILTGKNINLSYFTLYAQRTAALANQLKNNKKK